MEETQSRLLAVDVLISSIEMHIDRCSALGDDEIRRILKAIDTLKDVIRYETDYIRVKERTP